MPPPSSGVSRRASSALHLERGQAIAVREDRRREIAVDRVELRERLRHEHEPRAVLAELGEHAGVVDRAERARLVDQLDDAAALSGRERHLLLDQQAEQVQQRRADQRRRAFAERADGRVDDEHAAVAQQRARVEGRARLPEHEAARPR